MNGGEYVKHFNCIISVNDDVLSDESDNKIEHETS